MTGRGVVLACGDCVPLHSTPESQPVSVILLIAALAAIGCVILVWQLRRKRRPPRVTDQWGALVAMGDLCPRGWQAEIALKGWGATPRQDAAPPVALDWKLYEDAGARVAVSRRVCADTIGEALQMMVDDRRLDVMLEQIEQSAEETKDRI
jgi:hypothetical protein